MKRIPLVILLTLVLLVSCENSPKKDALAEPVVVTIDLSDLGIGGSITKTVSGNAEFQLKGLDLSDGVVIIDGNFSKSLSTGKGGSGSDSLFKREDGTFIPVPDKDKEAKFYGADISSLDLTTIHFKKLRLDDDFKIAQTEYPGRTGVEEEFYYLNFFSPQWQNLDRSEVVFWVAAAGHYGCSLIHWNTIRKAHNLKQVFDFSNPYFNTGLGIDLYGVLSSNSPDQCFRLYVLSPIELNEDETISIDGSRGLNIFKVQASENQEKTYKVVLTFSKNDYSKLNYESFHTYARYYDGTMRDDELIPFFNEETSTVELEIGKIDSAFIFNLDMSYSNTDELPPYTIKLTESGKTGIYSTLKTGETNTFVAYDSENSQTIAFKTTSEWTVEIKWADNVACVDTFCSGKNGYGTGSSRGSVTLLENMNYCFIVTFQEGVEHEAGDELFTISPRNNIELKCNVKYNGKGNYECAGCANCNYEGYLLNHVDIIENKILNGSYWTTTPLDTKYGNIGYVDGKYIKNDSSITLNSTTTGDLGGEAFGTLAMNGNDVKKDSIDIRVLEIRPSDKTIVADIKIDGGTTYKNIVMKYKEYHHWSVNDNNTVRCTDCGEIRNSASINIKEGTQYYIDANEAFSIWLEAFPDQEYAYKAGNNLKAPVAPADMTVRFIPSEAGKTISYTDKGENIIDITIGN